ncbi:MAG: hypothetical protein KZQ58_10325 [gamma proteobacterium symbiont of Bathyaustriella thionipta]|nr:hypothetical protein [gamma proteobacterium symbiont of Bathyaustriella thionipta]
MTLLLSFGLYAIITIAIILYAGVRPLEEKSADDLASMMLTSLQTWVMLPESAREDYADRVWASNHLKITAEVPGVSEDQDYHLRYLSLIEEALEKRTGNEFHFKVEKREDRY